MNDVYLMNTNLNRLTEITAQSLRTSGNPKTAIGSSGGHIYGRFSDDSHAQASAKTARILEGVLCPMSNKTIRCNAVSPFVDWPGSAVNSAVATDRQKLLTMANY